MTFGAGVGWFLALVGGSVALVVTVVVVGLTGFFIVLAVNESPRVRRLFMFTFLGSLFFGLVGFLVYAGMQYDAKHEALRTPDSQYFEELKECKTQHCNDSKELGNCFYHCKAQALSTLEMRRRIKP